MMTATIAAATAADTRWDVVVIGAGPAGSVAALQLARSGARTLLVDRKSFPRYKVCGGCLNGHAIAMLRSLGLDQQLSELGAQPWSEFRLHIPGRRLSLSLPGGIAVSRTRLDAMLVKAAITAGAHFLPGTSANTEHVNAVERIVTLSGNGQGENTVRTKIVLAADGLGHPSVSATTSPRDAVAAHSRMGLGALVETGAPEIRPGTLVMAIGRTGYAGMIRVEDGRLNVACALDPSSVHRYSSPARSVAVLLEEAGIPSTDWVAGVRWRGTPLLTRRAQCVAAPRLFMLGDAAGYVEPFTGEGMTWALSTAIEVVPLALKGLNGWDDALMEKWSVRYRRCIFRRQRFCRVLAALLRHPGVVSSAVGLLSRMPALALPLIRRFTFPVTPEIVQS